MPVLMDPSGRRIRKLRLSLTDACQFRCFYCMPQAPRFLPADQLLPVEEILAITSRLVELGIDQVRLTGGEPTLRPELPEIVHGLSRLPLTKLGMTSNGERLERLLPALFDAGLTHLNLSLDSLREEVFARITGGRSPAAVLRAARTARDLGLEVKLNTVLFRGLNDQEAPDFLRLAEQEGLAVRFLELMRIGPDHQNQRTLFISADEVISGLRESGESLDPLPGPPDSTSFDYRTTGGGVVGFIASESRPFCSTCSRLRLTATGRLRSCLLRDEGPSLRGLPPEAYPELLTRVLADKPLERLPHTTEMMSRIGG